MSIQILLVDDDVEFRVLCQRLLKKNVEIDCKVVEAGDASSAMQEVRNASFDCILVDYDLPDMSGIRLVDDLRHNQKVGTPVILLSAGNNDELTEYVKRSSNTTFLPKREIRNSGLVRALKASLEPAVPAVAQ